MANAVRACSHQLQAGETVITAANTGIDHWSRHVQAQTDHLAGKISAAEMEATFKRTKLAGPDDVTAWDRATKDWHRDSAACEPVTGADKRRESTLQTCRTRLSAIEQAMPAARNGMHDWSSHLAAMRRSAAGMDRNPMATWLKAWRAAPTNIKAWNSAKERLADVPRCTGG